MKKSEEYLKTCVQGEGANEVVSYAEALFAVQLESEELLKELQDKDALEYLKGMSFGLGFSDEGNGHDYDSVIIKDAKEALSIQAANFEKKAVEAFINYMRIFPGYTGYYIERQVEKFKQQLKTK